MADATTVSKDCNTPTDGIGYPSDDELKAREATSNHGQQKGKNCVASSTTSCSIGEGRTSEGERLDGAEKEATIAQPANGMITDTAPQQQRARDIDELVAELVDLPAPLAPTQSEPTKQKPQEPGAYTSSLDQSLRRTEEFQVGMLRQPSRRIPNMASVCTAVQSQNENENDQCDEQDKSCNENQSNHPANEQLVVACHVRESSLVHHLPVAMLHGDLDRIQNQSRREKTKSNLLLVGGLATVLGVVVAVIVILLNDNNHGAEETTQPTTVPSLAPTMLSMESYVLGLFPEDTIIALEDSSSPQAKAYAWLLSDTIHLPHLSDDRILQRYAMATIYFAMGGDNWFRNTNWLNTSVHECNWWSRGRHDRTGEYIQIQYNSSCEQDTSEFHVLEEEEGVIKHVWLWHNNVAGTLPPELFWLTQLRSISLDGCHVGGTIPSQIAKLTDLEDIGLGSNQLSGTIPIELAGLHNMTGLFLPNNHLTGAISSEFGQLSKLLYLILDDNQLTGFLATQLGLLASLEWLILSDEGLEGSIATELGLLTNLIGLTVQSTSLAGTLPTELGQLTELSEMLIIGNSFNGTIPTELGELRKLTTLQLGNNRFTGTVPPELVSLALNGSLESLQLSDNEFVGFIPEGLCLIDVASDCTEQFCGCKCVDCL